MAFAKISDRLIGQIHHLSKNELVVYIYLLKCMNAETKRCNPRQATIARATNLPTSRVCEAVSGLGRKGWAIADVCGNFSLPENVTENVMPLITENVMKRYGKRNGKSPKHYGKRNRKLRNP